jgi:hypothetical protein
MTASGARPRPLCRVRRALTRIDPSQLPASVAMGRQQTSTLWSTLRYVICYFSENFALNCSMFAQCFALPLAFLYRISSVSRTDEVIE